MRSVRDYHWSPVWTFYGVGGITGIILPTVVLENDCPESELLLLLLPWFSTLKIHRPGRNDCI